MDLRNLRALDVRQYADSRFATGCSAHSVKGEVSILRRVLNSLVENGALERNPVPRIMASVAESARAHPDPNRAESREAWTPEEAWCLLEFAKRHEPQWYPILMFYFQTGARLGEGLALRWDSVDLFGRNIHIRRAVAAGEEGEPKWGKQRHVPISDDLLGVLKWLARKRRLSEPWKSPELVFLSCPFSEFDRVLQHCALGCSALKNPQGALAVGMSAINTDVRHADCVPTACPNGHATAA